MTVSAEPSGINAEPSGVIEVTERYYDSDDADNFYAEIWGGEDIHIGLYPEGTESVRAASQATVDRLKSRLQGVTSATQVLDLGAGYGGTARSLAKKFGCKVTCLNLSEAQNARNRRLTRAQGLEDSIDVVHGNFEALPFESNRFDVVVSQDAILHSGKRVKVLQEVARVIKPQGQFLFTDPMQSDNCPEGVLGPVLARIHLETLGSFAFYRRELERLGFVELGVEDLTPQLGRHYQRVRQELVDRYEEMTSKASKAYVDRMLEGLSHWVAAEAKGYLAWGILHFRAP